MTETKVAIITENIAQSLGRDATTFATIAGLIGLGMWIDSGAMQWIGGLLGFLAIFVRATGAKKAFEKTPQEAADWLYAKYGVTADNS